MLRLEYSPVVKPVHIVTLTTDDSRDDFDSEVLHMGPHIGCGYWEQCMVCTKENYSPDPDEVEEYERHDEYHERIIDDWMTFQGCALGTHVDSAQEGLWDIFNTKGAGTFLVDCDYWGDDIWDVTLIKRLS